MKSKDGGPAFPNTRFIYEKGHELESGHVIQEPSSGMSLRDWFAGMALMSITPSEKDVIYSAGRVAEFAYRTADAMLAEREKEGK